MMKYKTNFKVVIILHLIGIILSGVLLFVVAEDQKYILKVIIAALSGSIAAQLLIYRKKPKWFDDKIKKHPDLP